jgi:hypothetical protein
MVVMNEAIWCVAYGLLGRWVALKMGGGVRREPSSGTSATPGANAS